MRKKIILLLLLLIYVPNVYAKDTIRKYMYYKTDKVYGPYSEAVTDEYPLMDKEDYIYTDYISSFEDPGYKEGREIINNDFYVYERIRDIDYIKIYCSGSSKVNIDTVDIEYNGEKIGYTYESDSGTLYSKIITFYLEKAVDPTKVYFHVKTNDDTAVSAYVIMGTNQQDYTYNWTSIGKEYTLDNASAAYYPNAFVKSVTEYTEEKEKASAIKLYKGIVTEYTYRDKLYHTYKLEKEYYSEYLTEPYLDYIYKDEGKYIDIEINENIDNSNDEKKDNETENSESEENNEILEIIDLDFSETKEITEIEVPDTYLGYKTFSNNVLNDNGIYLKTLFN